MAGNVRYVPHRKGMAEMLASTQIQDTMVQVTRRKYLPKVISLSPVSSGNYARSWAVDRGHRELGRGRSSTRRAVAILHNSAPYSGKVEQRHKVLAQIRAYIRQDNP